MSLDALISYVCKMCLGVALASGVAFASPYVLPLEGDLVKSEIIFLGKVANIFDENCISINVLFPIKGEFDEKIPFCTLGIYKNEIDLNFISKQKNLIFFVQKINDIYYPRFHYSSLAYLNERNCVAMLGVFDEKNNDYILESFQNFVGRFDIKKIPKKFFSNDSCKKWAY